MNDDELVLFGKGLDLDTPGDDGFWMERVEEILERAFKEHDAEYALNACSNLIWIAKISGKALAKMLYTLKHHWDMFDVEDTFEDYAYPKLGLDRHTIVRYIKIEEMLHELPEEAQNFAQRPIQQLIPVANALAQGYEFTSEDYNKFAEMPTYKDIQSAVNEITGKEPRKSGVTIFLDRDGSLWASNKEERKFIGSLETTDDSTLVQKAITRIVDRAGVMRQ
jgi:hypothetical protein